MRAGDLNNLRRELENFRPNLDELAARARAKRALKRERNGECPEHLAMVRRLWCSLGKKDDRRETVHPHHLQGGICRRRGLGKRSKDMWVVPLVWWRHEELHKLGSRHEHEYFMDNSHGRVDPYALAQGLYSAGCDLRRGAMILDAHQSQDRTLRLLNPTYAELIER